MALQLDNSQPLLIPLSQDTIAQDVPRITVHLAISNNGLENAILSLLGRNARFSVVKGSIGYAAESDVRLISEPPDRHGQRELNELSPPKLLYIGLDTTTESLIQAVRAGAWAYVSESADASELESVICSLVESNGSPLLRQIASSEEGAIEVIADLSAPRPDRDDPAPMPNPLKPLEVQILDLIARGEHSSNIGDIVGLAEQTVKNYVLKILDKTHTHNRAHAAALAAQRGWLSPLDIM
ncbi:MAG: response regulator transcription factor [Chloroflexi bacterium]|nr:response regulator transcription factor [Chloroflexota bacterium]